jgi:hypothetical protein
MYWLYYIVLPLFAAWKKRQDALAEAVFSLFGTMLSAYLAVWCESLVSSSLGSLFQLPGELKAWLGSAALLLIWVITAVIFKKIIDALVPEGLHIFVFPEKVEKYLVPAVVFFNTGLIAALLFTAFAISPATKYLPFITQNGSLCSATRYRMLWNSFFIDRFSFQSVTVNQRRRAFDRFVPENAEEYRKNTLPSKRRKVK